MNQPCMKEQTQEIEYHADRKIVEKHQRVPEFKGFESSIGAGKTRISDIGRRMITSADEKDLLFCHKPGYTWGMSTRTGPKQWDIV